MQVASGEVNSTTCGAPDALPLELVRRAVSSATVAFGFMVRDGESYLARNLGAILSLGANFSAFRVFYVENDSTDTTRSILRDFEACFPGRLQGRMLDKASAAFSRHLCAGTVEQTNCAARTSLLSRLRQQVLEMALAWPAWTAYVALDLDFINFSQEAYLHSFALAARRNASAFFAKSVFKNARGHVGLYDHAALSFDPRWVVGQAGRQRCHSHGRPVPAHTPQVCHGLNALKRGCLVPVRSAFGGFGTYFAGPLRRSSAAYVHGGKNEHMDFNEAIAAWAEAADARAQLPAAPHAYLDGAFKPEYGWGGNEFWVAFCAHARTRAHRREARAAAPPALRPSAPLAATEEKWARTSAQPIHDHCVNRRWRHNETNATWVHPLWKMGERQRTKWRSAEAGRRREDAGSS